MLLKSYSALNINKIESPSRMWIVVYPLLIAMMQGITHIPIYNKCEHLDNASGAVDNMPDPANNVIIPMDKIPVDNTSEPIDNISTSESGDQKW